MKIKETICTEFDERGRVVRRTRTVDVTESRMDRGYDYGTRYDRTGGPREVSSKRIYEAYEDYRNSCEW